VILAGNMFELSKTAQCTCDRFILDFRDIPLARNMIKSLKSNPTLVMGIVLLIIGIAIIGILMAGDISRNRDEGTMRSIEDRSTCITVVAFLLIFGLTLIVLGISQSKQQKQTDLLLENLQRQQHKIRNCNNCKKQIPVDSNICPYCGQSNP
jgi:hypothetical protein